MLFFRNFETTERFKSVTSHAVLKPIGTLPTTITSGASEFLTTAPAEGIIAGDIGGAYGVWVSPGQMV